MREKVFRKVFSDMDRVQRVQEFFAGRAAGWEVRFPDDGPSYARAVVDLAVQRGDTAIDVGCGTARAFVPLRTAVGPDGVVLGFDVTPEMIAEAVCLDRARLGGLVVADGFRLPLADASVDAVFTAGFLSHAAPHRGLQELARVTRSGGRLCVFHPVSRRALAARHGKVATNEDPLAPAQLERDFLATGWLSELWEDGEDRYLALAVRGECAESGKDERDV